MNSLLACTIVALIVLSLADSVKAAPMPDICDQPESGERLRCHFGNIIVQQQATTDMIDLMPNVPEIQKQSLRNQVARTERAKGRASKDDFRQIIRKSTAQCQIAEVIGDGNGDDDGECTGGEMCSEVIGDGIGDDDGICQPRNGKKREICVQICDAEGVNSNEENFDPELAVDVEEQLVALDQRVDTVDQKVVAVQGQVQVVDTLLRTPTGARDAFNE